ncbi:hypothetical protein C8Q78DRAFT_1013520 [Trametes maxima]|nr:hypothetical protein C8Q78DRAFT_1013520 [Trametes maxima]
MVSTRPAACFYLVRVYTPSLPIMAQGGFRDLPSYRAGLVGYHGTPLIMYTVLRHL